MRAPTRYFVCSVDHSFTAKRGMAYLFMQGDFETDNAIMLEHYLGYKRYGAGHWSNSAIHYKGDFVEITEKEFKEYDKLFDEFNDGYAEAEQIEEFIENLINKHKEVVS